MRMKKGQRATGQIAPPSAARSWGENSFGQLGDSTTDDRNLPEILYSPGGANDVTAIAAGFAHMLGIGFGGIVFASGSNTFGQLGIGTTTDHSTPLQVKGMDGIGLLNNIAAVAAGNGHSLALKFDGTVWAWGANTAGQLGDNTTTERHTPVQVIGLDNVTAIAAGQLHSLGLKSDGTVWAWGWNDRGQLGDDTDLSSSHPVQVKGPGGNGFLTDITAIAAGGGHNLALTSEGKVWSWGQNDSGQLGDGTTTDRRTPVQVKDPPEAVGGIFAAIAAGLYHSLAVTLHFPPLEADRSVWAWGQNDSGQLGDGTTTNRSTPIRVRDANTNAGLVEFLAVTAGFSHSLALKSDGTIWAWGKNDKGQLGDGTHVTRKGAVFVKSEETPPSLTGATAIAAGSAFSLALRADGALLPSPGSAWSWGWNLLGQLGDNTVIDRRTPVQVNGFGGVEFLTGVKSIAAGNAHSLAVRSDGTAWAWGKNDKGQLGDRTLTARQTPVQVRDAGGAGFLGNIVAVAAGTDHSLAVDSNGSVWAWGNNDQYQLGDGTTTDRIAPIQVKGPKGVGFLTNIIAVAAGQYHSLALKSDGTVWAWGRNIRGQLGDGTTANRKFPVQVSSPAGARFLNDVIAIATGSEHSLALKRFLVGEGGAVFAWGRNDSGQLGDGTSTNRKRPVQVKGPAGVGFLTDILVIAAGASHSLAVKQASLLPHQDTTLWAWGSNLEGQLGIGAHGSEPETSPLPVHVVGPDGVTPMTSVRGAAGGNYITRVVKSDGTVWACGYNGHGTFLDPSVDNDILHQVRGPGNLGWLTGITVIVCGSQHTLAARQT